jgi:23S rRNA (pseudouridine1915-N3)-methyltransferase
MEITILAVGKIKDPSWQHKIEEYAGRIRHDIRLELAEIKDSGPKTEAVRLLGHVKHRDARIIALDERGKQFSSQGFARFLDGIPQRIVFIVGGPTGLDESVRQAAHDVVALSGLTFTHEIARVLLLEQIYRALSILKNRRYHKE